MDWVAGIAAAHKDKTYSSEYGLQGFFCTLFSFYRFRCSGTCLIRQ
ncbi:hypothetical protein [Aneurinibacillus tyrosinisolvens]|nr:hypothetical protein [Aneurinibacillus tyrosinisolvens]